VSGSSAGTEAETTRTSNVRRENKLYSYKEQMADIELRRVRTVLDLPLCLYWGTDGADGRHGTAQGTYCVRPAAVSLLVTETNVSNFSHRPTVSSET